METNSSHQIIDLHCDTITRCHDKEMTLDDPCLHFQTARIPKSLRVGQAAAIFVPDRLRGKEAQDYFLSALSFYQQETSRKRDELAVITDPFGLPEALEEKQTAFFLTVEGGAALGGQLDWVDRLWESGVRMMTLTWNGANELAGGFASGGGFTDFGRQAVSRMEELGMAVDVSHLSDEAFWELCDFAQQPFAASHSNARAVCDHPRNLTDEMFREIVARKGIVGLNYYVQFIQSEGKTSSLDDLLRHIHHFLELGGEDVIALGSDFDGADVPTYLSGVWDLEHLIRGMERSGLTDAVIQKILFDNAYRYLTSIWKKR